MPASPAVLKCLQAIRKALTTPAEPGRERYELSASIMALFSESGKIVENIENLQAVLAFAPEIEAFRGKGSQYSINVFSRRLYYLVYEILERLPLSETEPEFFIRENEIPQTSQDVAACLEALAIHAFQRVQGPKVRSRQAAELRVLAWDALSHIADVLRRPEHLAHALAVGGNKQASVEERDAAVQYLAAYYADEDPDEATVSLLKALKEDPPNRELLVTVLQAQIDLGLGNEWGALSATEDWDDAHEND